MKINSIEDIVQADLCLGCGVCASFSDQINVEINSNGFYRPETQIDDPKTWETVKRICPGIRLVQDKKATSKVSKLWGPIRQAFVGHSTDENLRWRASSGGALSALVLHLLETKQIDCVIHAGPNENAPLETIVTKSYTRENVFLKTGSRYTPTSPLRNIDDLLDSSDKAAFIGKPCDVAALRAYITLKPPIAENITAIFSFFCAGVPSQLATLDAIQALEINVNTIKSFRYRGFGWPGRMTAIDTNDQEFSLSYLESWGKILNKKLQFRCKICPDGIGEFADIACGDAWHTKDGYPDFEERPGQSLIIARTEKGEMLLSRALEDKYIYKSDFDINTLDKIQPYQRSRRQAILPRLIAMKIMGKTIPQYEGFYLLDNAIQGGVFYFFMQFSGMLRRLLSKKRTY